MTTLHSIQLDCPVCETTFDSLRPVVDDADVPGAHEGRVVVQDMLPYLIHVCHCCGYAGHVGDFGRDVHIAPETAARVWTELSSRLPAPSRLQPFAMTVPGSEKYEAAAKVADWRWADARSVGELWLHGATCCVLEGDVEAERYFLISAVAWLAEALDGDEGVRTRERAGLALLIGELWLRIGNTRRAADWFERVPAEVVDPQLQRDIVHAARGRMQSEDQRAA